MADEIKTFLTALAEMILENGAEKDGLLAALEQEENPVQSYLSELNAITPESYRVLPEVMRQQLANGAPALVNVLTSLRSRPQVRTTPSKWGYSTIPAVDGPRLKAIPGKDKVICTTCTAQHPPTRIPVTLAANKQTVHTHFQKYHPLSAEELRDLKDAMQAGTLPAALSSQYVRPGWKCGGCGLVQLTRDNVTRKHELSSGGLCNGQ